MAPFFYCSHLPEGSLIELDADTSHHMAQVLRMRVDDLVYLTDGLGTRLFGRLREVSKKACVFSVEERVFIDRFGRQVQVAIAPIKNAARLEWFIEKATELGVSHISTILTARTEKQRLRIDRLRQIAIAAMLQSQQVWLPAVEEPVSFESLINSWKEISMQRLIAHCEEKDRKPIAKMTLESSVGILIGPEGDFTPAEIELATQAGFQPVQLGATRLRTETAGVVGATLLRLLEN